ncbi:MAG: conjugal transfer protein TrbD [Planctomycetota bacterium]|jgi:type IV secretion system protein VirB3|nr:conjugal transfer protein TrbD [Planctomycetota bacterium]
MNDDPLESVPIHRGLTRRNLVLGCDRELVLFSGLIAGTLVFYAFEIKAAIVGIAFWIFSLFILRLMAKHDPRMRETYLRHRLYKPYYPPHSTPWRDNADSQGKQYRDPWRIS